MNVKETIITIDSGNISHTSVAPRTNDVQFLGRNSSLATKEEIDDGNNRCNEKETTHEILQKVLSEIIDFSNFMSTVLAIEVQVLVSTIGNKTITIYLLGTNYSNPQCRHDVVSVIRKVQPTDVVVELCRNRVCACDEEHRDNIFRIPFEYNYSYLRKAIRQIGFIARSFSSSMYFAKIMRTIIGRQIHRYYYRTATNYTRP